MANKEMKEHLYAMAEIRATYDYNKMTPQDVVEELKELGYHETANYLTMDNGKVDLVRFLEIQGGL
ncbi:hypothetical protein [Rummeliibacillus stabekisii]|uniref:hypothetical protein n=1 Tax=Rummeliibacillus stabekisii TaxID=241244 RepID=UPI003718658F